MNDAPLSLLYGLLILLLALSAFFSSSETGMMSLNRYRLRHLKQTRHRGARRASRLLQHPDRLISLILIGNNLVNFTASAIVTIIGYRLFGDAGIAIATLVFTLTVLVFAEITPKTYAALYPEKVAFPASKVLKPLMKVLQPAIWLVNLFTNKILKLLGLDLDKNQDDQLSTDELRTIVGEAGPHIPARHQAMLLNILDLEQLRVDDIMIPRNDIFRFDISEDDATLIAKARRCSFTRVPVVDNDFENIFGTIHMRLASHFLIDGELDREALLALVTEPYFVPEGTPLHTQMFNFQKNKRRVGLVVDEYGEILGLITLEDILEEIVGEFTSNLAEPADDIYPQSDGSYIINATTTVRDINRTLGWDLPVKGPKTLSGLIIEKLEAFPEGNVGLLIDEYAIEVLKIQRKIIQQVRAKTMAVSD